jgi:DNA-binding transcriptional MerR regulator
MKMSSYTVKQLSDLAKISWRTFHCYDQIGLLESETYGANGYRRYR